MVYSQENLQAATRRFVDERSKYQLLQVLATEQTNYSELETRFKTAGQCTVIARPIGTGV